MVIVQIFGMIIDNLYLKAQREYRQGKPPPRYSWTLCGTADNRWTRL